MDLKYVLCIRVYEDSIYEQKMGHGYGALPEAHPKSHLTSPQLISLLLHPTTRQGILGGLNNFGRDRQTRSAIASQLAVRVRVCVCVRARARVCVCVCVRACVRMRKSISFQYG